MLIYGLVARSDSVFGTVDLLSTSVNVVIRGFVANLSVELLYQNNYDCPVEVSYVCPVDANAAIYSLTANVQGRVINAHCLEKEEAEKLYETAVRHGQTAVMAAEHDSASDVLRIALGNLPKGERAEVRLQLVMELRVGADGGVTFVLPTVFNPRYFPDADSPAAAAAAAQGLPPPWAPFSFQSVYIPETIANRIPYSLAVKAEVRGSLRIAKVSSETNPLNVALEDDQTTAIITQDGESTYDQDWSFDIFYHTVHVPQALQMAGDRNNVGMMKDDMLMLNVFPEVPPEGFSPHNELIFVVDRSGSMEGTKIENAKGALLLFLKSLPPGCRFNIVSFGFSVSALFARSSERYTESTLSEAVALQRRMDADMGGTEIVAAFRKVFEWDLIPGYPRQVLLLTDGEVWNQHALFELVSRRSHETRVFAVGIGHGASSALVKGVAEAGKGRHVMVLHEKELQTKVMGLVASMLQQNARDLRVEVEVEPRQQVSLVPSLPPVVFGGQHLILFARLKPKSKVSSIKVSWAVDERTMTTEIGDPQCKLVHDHNLSFHRLAAKKQLKQWDLEYDVLSESKYDMITLSLNSNVVCRFTAFVGIDQDRRVLNAEDQPRPRQIPDPAPQSLVATSALPGRGSSLQQPQSARAQSVWSPLKKTCVPFKKCRTDMPEWLCESSDFLFESNSPQTRPISSRSFDSSSGSGFGSSFASYKPLDLTSSKQLEFANRVEMCANNAPAPPRTRILKKKWCSGGSAHAAFGSSSGTLFGSSSNAPQTQQGGTFQSASVVPNYLSPSRTLTQQSFRSFEDTEVAAIPGQTPTVDPLLEIVSSQHFDGSWDLADCLAFVTISEQNVKEFGEKVQLSGKWLATVLVLALLRCRFASRATEWRLIAVKARAFLTANAIVIDPLLEASCNYLKDNMASKDDEKEDGSSGRSG